MSCVCDAGATLGLRNTYWLPYQWDRALQRALREGRETGRKHRVRSTRNRNGIYGWKVEPATPPSGLGETP